MKCMPFWCPGINFLDINRIGEPAKEWDQFETNREVCQDFLKKLNLGDRSQFYYVKLETTLKQLWRQRILTLPL